MDGKWCCILRASHGEGFIIGIMNQSSWFGFVRDGGGDTVFTSGYTKILSYLMISPLVY